MGGFLYLAKIHMKKTIIGIGITLFVILVLVLVAQPSEQADSIASQAPNPGSLTAEETSFDFGTISMANGKVSHIFNLENIGIEPVTIKKMYTSCMCTTASLNLRNESFGPYGMAGHGFIPPINKSISPGEEGRVEVVFDPAAHGPAGIGKIQRVVTIENNSGSPLELNFTAMVTP
jgi:hypothetical protein